MVRDYLSAPPPPISAIPDPTVPPPPEIDSFTVPGYALYFAQTKLFGLRPSWSTLVGNCLVVTGETPPFVFCVKRAGVYILLHTLSEFLHTALAF